MSRRPYAARVGVAERREQVLDATLELVATQGWRAVSMESIARALDVTRPVVYRAYPGLPGVLAALLLREQKRALAVLDRAVPEDLGDRDPFEVLRSGLHEFFAAVQEHPATWRVILLPVEGTPQVVLRTVERRRAALARRIASLMQWALPRLGAPAQMDPELLARLVVATAEEAGRLVLTDPQRWPPERFERSVARLLDQIVW